MSVSTRKHDGSAQASHDDVVDELLRRLGADVRAETVFGDPVEHEGVQVIPVARASWGMGTGRTGDKRGSSRGLGAGMRVSPVGYIELTENGARFRPIRSWWVEFTYVLGAGFLALLFLRWRGR